MNLNRCKHGLCRNCHLCYYEDEIARLKAEIEHLKGLKGFDSTASPSEAAAVQGPGLIPGGST